MHTKSYAALTAKTSLVPFEFERRKPGNQDLLIQITHCGICHSDIHQARAEWGDAIFPMVPGHEIVGEVLEVGSQVSKFKKGDRVGVGCFVDSCRSCSSCKEGLEQYCENQIVFTYNSLEKDGKTPTFGGYSSHIVVDESYALSIPENIPMANAAPLLCAGITMYSPLKHWQIGKGHKIAILGLGGLGHMGVKIGAALGAEVTVLSGSKGKAEDAARLGAHDFLLHSDQSELDRGAGKFDFIINTVSSAHDLSKFINLLKRDGTLVMVGVAPEPLPLALFPIIGKRRRVAGSMIGGIKETQEMLNFCGQHSISSDIELIAADQINTAYERVLKSDVKYRFVIDLATL